MICSPSLFYGFEEALPYPIFCLLRDMALLTMVGHRMHCHLWQLSGLSRVLLDYQLSPLLLVHHHLYSKEVTSVYLRFTINNHSLRNWHFGSHYRSSKIT